MTRKGLEVVWTDDFDSQDLDYDQEKYEMEYDMCVPGTVEIREGNALWKVIYKKDPAGHWWSEEWILIGKGLELFF